MAWAVKDSTCCPNALKLSVSDATVKRVAVSTVSVSGTGKGASPIAAGRAGRGTAEHTFGGESAQGFLGEDPQMRLSRLDEGYAPCAMELTTREFAQRSGTASGKRLPEASILKT